MQERGPGAALSLRWTRLAVTGGVGAVVVAADQATTSWAVADLHHPVHLVGPLGLALQYNQGAAFSLWAGSGAAAAALAVVALVVVAALAWRATTTTAAVGFGLVVGGAVGNLADRAWRGHGVVDYITLSHWPTFNVADAAITAGVVILVVSMVRGVRGGAGRSQIERPPPGPAPGAPGSAPPAPGPPGAPDETGARAPGPGGTVAESKGGARRACGAPGPGGAVAGIGPPPGRRR